MPESYDAATLTVDGEAIEIVDANGMPNRRYLWSPTLRAVFGGVLIFSGVHVWTADTKGAEQRAAWRSNLDAIAARAPDVVVPGHMATTAKPDASAIAHTKAWLAAFEQELPKAKDAAALIDAIKARYPDADMGIAIDIGAKVAKGEMAWGKP
ncbi:Arsenate reductase, glutaredoxin family [Terricaulis silvestris]|uniref:Arsenate reductase, glutaredoxin family n=2 Tax=Terricaulis silvestris TaxID=2686094 RepID=A0A6I6MH84_9CAUL|nr:Arsenate reductase, glutaredoxin family [Terricaulis silvestris]